MKGCVKTSPVAIDLKCEPGFNQKDQVRVLLVSV